MAIKGVVIVMEFQVSENDFLFVDVTVSDDKTVMFFEFDRRDYPDCDVYFSGEIEKVLNYYQLKINPQFGIDWHLQKIYNEMVEGFIVPNGLYYDIH